MLTVAQFYAGGAVPAEYVFSAGRTTSEEPVRTNPVWGLLEAHWFAEEDWFTPYDDVLDRLLHPAAGVPVGEFSNVRHDNFEQLDARVAQSAPDGQCLP
eukprot:1158907-Rhodomonas_salina.1